MAGRGVTGPTFCALCSGRIHLSTLGSGFDHPVWVHDDADSWAENPHNARPRGEVV